MQRQLKITLFFLILVFAKEAFAELAFSSNARTFETQHSTLSVKGLAHSCLTLTTIPDGLPCNPAQTPLNSSPKLGVELLLSNGTSSLENLKKLLDGEVNQDLVDTLFNEGQIMQIESNSDVNFQSKFFNAQYVPYTIKGLSVVRNEADPDVDLYVVEEKAFLFQTGYEIFNDFYAGIQTRFVDRKFINKRFKLISLGTQAGSDLLRPQHQTATYIEPGFTYFLEKKWRSRVSLMVVNSGTISEKNDDLKTPVEVQLGFGFSPPIGWGVLDISLEYRSMNYNENDLQKLRLGSMYRFGSMYLTAGIDANGISGGVFYGLDQINAGIMYSTTRLVNENDEYFTQTVYAQLGWQI